MSESSTNPELQRLRQKMDRINLQMAELFVSRLNLAGKIGEIKKQQGLSLYDAKREEEMLAMVLDQLKKDDVAPWVRSYLTRTFDLTLDYLRKS
ncbi:MAG: chorismate mutase [Bdellovibrionaceae bacterium]|nr:chorismate mutase [Bdellovibrionales bacterium]MCB9085700.1 chorismate mutase [Pseudobdellovibrionaceae bacterium]